MNSLPANFLLNFGVNLEIAAKKSSVRKRVKGQSPKLHGAGNQSPGMVPRIAVVPYDVEDLSDDKNGEQQLSKTWTESEDGDFNESITSLNRSKHYGHDEGTTNCSDTNLHVLNGDVPYESSDQLVPLLEQERGDGFKTEIAGTGDSSSEEGSFTIGLQVFFPFLVAGFGTVSAGILLDVVQVSFKYKL